MSSVIFNTYTKTEAYNLFTNISLTGPENTNIMNSEISFTYPLKNNNAPFLNPRVNAYFEIYAAPNCISFLQHTVDGSQPIAIFSSLDKSVEFFRGLDIPTYNKNETDNLITNLNLVNYYTKNQIGTFISDINVLGC